MNIGPMHMGACRPGLFRMGRIRSHKSEYGSHVSQQITSIYVRISILLLLLLGECGTLWGEREQAMHYSIDCYVTKAILPASEVSYHST